MNETGLAHKRLSALRHTFPAFDIARGRDETGQEWWIARLRREATERMQAAGVIAVVQRRDYASLASSLACQAAILHHFRA
ncbi:hypothetical protein HII36_05320 [Nonomuraea sp. NN258]|uniref:hypothetical protein n=1 Tax=Nonomuraea antri TaxID=2730852 RepID=UPI001569AD8C|nr:hypothetical protein [Nonomuraea antri]NRQ31257.1 hypothetical protein [Nonomuraea antri]